MTISDLCTACDNIAATTVVTVWDNAEYFHIQRCPNRSEWLMRMPIPVITRTVERFRLTPDGLDILIEGKLKEEE